MQIASLYTTTMYSLVFTILINIATLAPLLSYHSAVAEATRFRSIISFGDSFTDTGNALHICRSLNKYINLRYAPYGNTFFHHPTGRASDGRLVVDFLAERFGIPFVPPYLEINDTLTKVGEGINFATGGATVLDSQSLAEMGVTGGLNISLRTELGWFKEMLANVCPNHSDCEESFRSTLFLVGELGGNDFFFSFSAGKTYEHVESVLVPMATTVGSVVSELIELGAATLVVPGALPNGCLSWYLTNFSSSANKEDYDPTTGCYTRMNTLAQNYNKLLQLELHRLQDLHPRANIIYADYYNAAMQMFNSPKLFGLEQPLRACCGGGGKYNYNSTAECGNSASTTCNDPSLYVNWDGIHLTEAACRSMAQGLLEVEESNKYLVPMDKHKRTLFFAQIPDREETQKHEGQGPGHSGDL